MTSNLGDKIKRLRIEKNMTLDELAQIIEAQKSYVWGLENRKIEKPSAEKLTKIAEALGVTVEYLLSEAEELDESNKKNVLFRNYNKLSPEDQEKIDQMIKLWGKK
ncbi:MAG: helix-turn-helix domain-containing protein [Lactobacillaceae bacterium]|nr:helix-turn-helix domain-containing protein [Lactobacillaceae bacterium]